MKVLVVGCGSIGIRHLTCLLAREGKVEPMAFDVSPQGADRVKALSTSIPFFANYDQALAEKPDLVIICTPNEQHEECALAAFQANAHVLCEKPIAHSVESGRRIVEAAQRFKRILAVGYTERFRPSFEFITETVHSPDFGVLVGGRSLCGTYNTLLCAKSDFRSVTFGALIVDYTHELNMLQSLFGPVRDLVCKGNAIAHKPLDSNPSLAAMLIEYNSGAIVSVHFDYVEHPQRRIMEIIGSNQTIEFDLQLDQVKIFDWQKPGVMIRQFDNIRNDRFVAEHSNIFEAITKGTRPRVDGHEALDALITAEKAIDQLRK